MLKKEVSKVLTAGWALKEYEINDKFYSEDELWGAINNVLSPRSKNTTSYKFCFLKSILDNIYNVNENLEMSMLDIFSRFAEIYWNLIVKHHLNQIQRGKKSAIGNLIEETRKRSNACDDMRYEWLPEAEKQLLVRCVVTECSKYVVGALCADLRGIVYGFDKRKTKIKFNYSAYIFLVKYAYMIGKLNYFEWIKYMEGINGKDVAYNIASCLDDSSQRMDLSRYRKMLIEGLNQHTCFYCGKELRSNCDVDHFIPWSFVKDDKAWNFVPACKHCNTSKSDKLTEKVYVDAVIKQNQELIRRPMLLEEFKLDFEGYNDNRLFDMYNSAAFNGFITGWRPRG